MKRVAVWKLSPVDRRKRRLSPRFMVTVTVGDTSARLILPKRDAAALLKELAEALK